MEVAGPRVSSRSLALRAALVGVAALVAASVMLRPFPLDEPLTYGDDVFAHLAVVQSTDWTGTPGRSEVTGAPWGTDWSALPSGGERLHLVVLNAAHELSGDPWVAMNLHVLAGVVATAVVAFLVLRWLGVHDLFAGAAGVLFALLPAFHARLAVGHLFLFALYPAALGVYLAVRASGWPERLRIRRAGEATGVDLRAWLVPALAVVAVGASSTYYTVFAVAVVLGVGALVALRRADWGSLVAPAVIAVALAAVLAMSSLPDLLGGGSAVVERRLSDADSYALRVTQLLAPQRTHPVAAMAALGRAAARVAAPADPGAAVGTLAVVGLAILACIAVRRLGRPRDLAERAALRLGAVAAVGVGVATVGGVGFLIAVAGGSEVRAWSRMAVLVGFCGLAGLGLWATRLFGVRRVTPLVAGATALVVVLGLADQRMALRTDEARAQLAEDRELRDRLGELLAGDDDPLVLQLPAPSFPDDVGSHRLLAAGLEPVVADGTGAPLRFSGGTLRGGPGDWQQSWALEPLDVRARAGAAAGFDVLLVDLGDANLADPGGASAELTELLGPPDGRSDEGNWAWWDLRPLRADLSADHGTEEVRQVGAAVARPVGVRIEGTSGYPFGRDERDVPLRRQARIVLVRHPDEAADPAGPDDRTSEPSVGAVVRGTLRAAPGAVVELRWPGGSRRLRPGPDGGPVELRVPLDAERTVIEVELEGGPLEDDPRHGPLHARWDDLAVFDSVAVDSPVLRDDP